MCPNAPVGFFLLNRLAAAAAAIRRQLAAPAVINTGPAGTAGHFYFSIDAGKIGELTMLVHPIALGIAVFFGIITVRDRSENYFMLIVGAAITAVAAAVSAMPD